MAKLGGRVWVLIVFLFLALLVIDPSPISTGVEIRSIDSNSPAFAEGIEPGEKILEINEVKINELIDFKIETDKLIPESQEVSITTSEGVIEYNIISSIGFKVDSNLTIIAADSENSLENGARLLKINNEDVKDVEGFNRIISKLINKSKCF